MITIFAFLIYSKSKQSDLVKLQQSPSNKSETDSPPKSSTSSSMLSRTIQREPNPIKTKLNQNYKRGLKFNENNVNSQVLIPLALPELTDINSDE